MPNQSQGLGNAPADGLTLSQTLAAGGANQRVLAFVGNSISSGTADTVQTGYTSYVKYLGGGRVSLARRSAANWAWAESGYTIQQMIDAGFHTGAAASNADTVVIGLPCANDFPTALNYQAIYQRILILCAPTLAARKSLIYISDTPRGYGSTQGTAENRQYQAVINSMVQTWCVENGARFVNVHDEAVERTTGNYRDGLTPDYVHPSEAYHWNIAVKLLGALGITYLTDGFPALAEAGFCITGNPRLQDYTDGLAAGWAENNITASAYTNTRQDIDGESQQIVPASPTSTSFPQLYRTDSGASAGLAAGKTLRIMAVFEVIGSLACLALKIGATLYKDGGGTQAFSAGINNSSLAIGSTKWKMANGLYVLENSVVAEDGGNVLLEVGCQGGGAIVHFAGAYVAPAAS